MYHTWNTFRSKIKEMKQSEREAFLKELRADLIYYKTRRFQEPNTMRINQLKKQIACLKTIMGVKGFHYNPREIS